MFKTGRYEIVGELGRGSMGVVYEGFDPLIHRRVAIKTMRIEGLSPREYEQYKARFQAEAQAAGILEHPNIVTIHDFGEDNGVLYLAMEFLKGKSLRQIVDDKGILPVETIIPIFQQVSSALDHAHEHHIIHRDIKPANIMVLDSGLVKVTDFGIAKVLTTETGMTYAGQILGTPNYMSPEQVKGERVDARSDIFALGVILYELVTGQKPFGGQNVTTVMYKIINEQPASPLEVDPAIHPGLGHIINRSLAKRPEDRYQTCRQLADDLTNYKNVAAGAAVGDTVVAQRPPLPSPPQPTTAPPVETRRFPVIGASVAALVVVVGLAVGYYLRSRQHLITATPSASPSQTSATRTATPPAGQPANPAISNAGPESAQQPAGGGSLSTPNDRGTSQPKTEASESKGASSAVTEAKPRSTLKTAMTRSSPPPPIKQSAQGRSAAASQPPENSAAKKDSEPAQTTAQVQQPLAQPSSGSQVAGESGANSAAASAVSAQSSEYVFETDPNGVDVFVDGKLWGRTDKDKPVVATLTVGDHTLVMKYRGVEVLKRQIKKTTDAQWQKWKLPITEPVP